MQDHTMPVQYFIKRKETMNGPFSLNQIQKAIKSSQIKSQDQISISEEGPWDGMKDVYKQILDGSYVSISEPSSVSEGSIELNLPYAPEESPECREYDISASAKDNPEASEDTSVNPANENSNIIGCFFLLGILGVILGLVGAIFGLPFSKEIFWGSIGIGFIAILFASTDQDPKIEQERAEKERVNNGQKT